MPPEYISTPFRGLLPMRLPVFIVLAFALAARSAFAQDDASAGYAKIKPSLVKVWALDKNGRPIDSGTGFVVASDPTGSSILTAEHTVEHAASLIVNIPGESRDIAARVHGNGPVDTALLDVDVPNLTPVQFVNRDRHLTEGSNVAVAGFLKNDESIEIAGLAPRVLYPGTIASLPSGGKYIDLANLNIEEGLSGAPVFDPQSGNVLGMVDTRSTDHRGRSGYAISAPAVLSQFLGEQGLQVAYGGESVAFNAGPPMAANVQQDDQVPAIPPYPATSQTQVPAWQPPSSMEPAVPIPAPEPLPQPMQIPFNPPRQAFAQWNPAIIGAAIMQGPAGVVLRHVALNGPAHRAGLMPGDVIVEINGRQIASAPQARQIIATSSPGTPLLVAVNRRGQMRIGSIMVAAAPGW
jgi:S1-C subfamily serine protease